MIIRIVGNLLALLLMLSCSKADEPKMNKPNLFACILQKQGEVDPFSGEEKEEQEENWLIKQQINFDQTDFIKAFKKIPVVKEQEVPFVGFSNRVMFFDGRKYWLISFLEKKQGVIAEELVVFDKKFKFNPKGVRKEGSDEIAKLLEKAMR